MKVDISTEYGIPIYKVNIGINTHLIHHVEEYFSREGAMHHLERGGLSTRTFDGGMHLHNIEEFKDLSADIIKHADVYWGGYGLDRYYEPYIKQSWSNRHYRGNETLSHIHSGSPIVATYYMQAPEDSGRIYFENPLEYHQCHEPRSNDNRRYIDIEDGTLLIFPGFLKHGTEASQTDLPRTVLSINFGYENRKPVITYQRKQNENIN
jgi:uncharacterized protein (TIGR02466 family)